MKNTWGAQLQPGIYIPFNSPNFRGMLLYGTTGFASTDVSIRSPQSDLLCTPEIRNGRIIDGVTPVYYPSSCNNPQLDPPESARFPAGQSAHSRLNGLVLGVGAKLAFSERVYGVFDFTYIIYNKLKDIDVQQTQQVNRENGRYVLPVNPGPIASYSANYSSNWSRDYSVSGARIRQSFIFIGAGFRFF